MPLVVTRRGRRSPILDVLGRLGRSIVAIQRSSGGTEPVSPVLLTCGLRPRATRGAGPIVPRWRPERSRARGRRHADSSIAAPRERSCSQASIPFVFLHERFQPDLTIASGSTSVDVRLADGALLVVVVVALVSAVRFGHRAASARTPALDPGRAARRLARARVPAARLTPRRALRRPPRELPQVRRIRAARRLGAAARPAQP